MLNTCHEVSEPGVDMPAQPVSLARELYAHPFRVLHLVFLALALLMLLAGIMIHAGSAPGWSFFGGHSPSWLPPVRWGMWHVLGGALLLGTFLPGMAFYIYQSSQCRRPAGRALWHWLLWITLGIMCLSGLFLSNDWGPARLYRLWRTFHLVTGVIVLPVVLVGHVCKGWRLGLRFWLRCFDPVSRPRKATLFVLLVPGLALGAFLALGGVLNPATQRVLTAPRVSSVPADLWAFDWDSLTPLKIRLGNF